MVTEQMIPGPLAIAHVSSPYDFANMIAPQAPNMQPQFQDIVQRPSQNNANPQGGFTKSPRKRWYSWMWQ